MSGPESGPAPASEQIAAKAAQATELSPDDIARQAADAVRTQIETDAFAAPARTLDAVAKQQRGHNTRPWNDAYEQANNTWLSAPNNDAHAGNMETYVSKGLNKVQVTRRDATATKDVVVTPEGVKRPFFSSKEGGATGRSVTSTTESIGPKKGLGIMDKRPKAGSTTLQSSAEIRSPRAGRPLAEDIAATPDGHIVDGTDSTVTEVKRGKQRVVTRTVTTGIDNEGETRITVNQRSTDLRGENPRERTWEHTPEEPQKEQTISIPETDTTPAVQKKINEAKVARKAANAVRQRVVDRQL